MNWARWNKFYCRINNEDKKKTINDEDKENVRLRKINGSISRYNMNYQKLNTDKNKPDKVEYSFLNNG